MLKLIDVTDKRIRFTQHISMIVAGVLAGVGIIMLISGIGPAIAAGAALASAAVLLLLTASVKQRYEVTYRGHTIGFENSAVLAERLYLDGGLVARGGVGRKTELRAPVRVGEAAGAEIVALTDAKLWSFRLRLFVEAPEGTAAPVDTVGSTSAPSQEIVAPAAEGRLVTDSAVLAGALVAKQVVELLAAVVGLIGGISVILGWLS